MTGRDRVGCAKGDACECNTAAQWNKCLEPLRNQINQLAPKSEPLVITFSGEMPQKRQMVFQMGVAADTDQATINALLDKTRIAFERQFAFGEIEIHKLELEQQEKQAHEHAARLSIVEDNVYRDWQTNGRRGEIKLSHKQEQEKKQAHENARAIQERIAKVKKYIEACETKIAG